jgi:hypothetical protein
MRTAASGTSSQKPALTNLIIDHTFIRFGDATFRQIRGIPMGINPAVFFASIYLLAYEYRFMQRLYNTVVAAPVPVTLPPALTAPTAGPLRQLPPSLPHLPPPGSSCG